MPQIDILTEAELRQCISLDKQAINMIEAAFKRLAGEGVVMPPVLSMDLPELNGEVDIKTAYIPGMDNFAIKVSPGFFNNPGIGLPSLNGLMVVLSAETGVVKAVLLDNGYLTDVRTAAAGGVAARYLGPLRVGTAGVIGAGVQAGLQLQALMLERDVDEVLVWSRNRERAEKFAREHADRLNITISVAANPRALVEASRVVITTTPAREPVIQAQWLHPGLHITAMGSDSPDKNELDPAILLKADCMVVDRVQQSIERGEMRSAINAGLMSVDQEVDELGMICSGELKGRSSEDQITVCDLTGTGVQDTAIANFALTEAQRKNIGTSVNS